MFKELICAVALSGTIGMTAPQNSNDGTYYQDVTITETYEYQTNEVNSVDDLVNGNIYKYHYTSDIENVGRIINATYIHIDEILDVSIGWQNNNIRVNTTRSSTASGLSFQFEGGVNDNVWYINDSYMGNEYDIYFVWYSSAYMPTGNLFIERITASDYLGEKTITITPKEYNGLFSIFDNFLHERLFSGGILDTTNVTVFNATMSLGQWLSTTTSIVLLCLIVLLLVLLIKFIFKYVGGMMIWRS